MELSQAMQSASVRVTGRAMPATVLTDAEQTSQPSSLVTSFLRMDGRGLSKKQTDQVNEIYEYATQRAGTEEELKVLEVLRDIKYRMGAPSLDETHLNQLHRYVRLRSLAAQYDAQAQAMEQ